MTSCFVCAILNLGRKKSTGTEPQPIAEVAARSPGDPGDRGPEVPARKSVAAIFNMIKSVCATDLVADLSPPIYDKFW